MRKAHCHIPTLVISFLGVFALISLIGAIWLVANKVDAAVVAIISGLSGTALGFLGGVLAKTDRPPPGEAVKVHVDNEKTDAIPTTDVKDS